MLALLRRLILALALPSLAFAQAGVVLSGAGLGNDAGGGGGGAGDEPVASVTASRTSCFAPCDVHFDARATTDPDLTTRTEYLLDLTYVWDFADPGAGEWTHGIPGDSKNVDEGFVQAHVYETADTFTWRLVVSDADGNSDEATGTVTVVSQDSNFPTTQTICVPATGSDFTGCPAGATQASASSDFDAIFNTTCNLDGAASDTRCLLQRGGTYTSSVRANPRTTSADIVMGAYGSGAKPLVNLSGGHAAFEFADTQTMRGIVSDIKFVGTDVVNDAVHSQPFVQTTGNLFVRIDAEDMESPFIHYTGAGAFDPDVGMPRYNTWYETTTYSSCDDVPPSTACSNGANESFFEGDFMALLGSRWGDKEGDEHVFRSGWLRAGVVAHNSFGNNIGDQVGCGTIRLLMKIHNNQTLTTEENGEFVITGNKLTQCDGNDAMVNIGVKDAASPTEAAINWLYSRNWHLAGPNVSGVEDIAVHTGPGKISNNLFDGSELAGAAGTARAIRLFEWASPQDTKPSGVRIINNTFYKDTATNQSLVAITTDTASVGTIIKNNLLYDPGADITNLTDNGSGTVLCIGSAFAPCNVDAGASTPFVSSAPTAFTDFELSAASAAFDDGELVASSNLYFTGLGKPEFAETNLDAGAWQRSNTPASVGFNASRTAPDRTNIPFADLMKSAGGSSTGAWTLHDAGTPTYDANGYPVGVVSGTDRVRLSLIDPPDADYPAGTYSLQITGTSSIVLTGDATGTYSAGTSAVTVTPSGTGITLRVESGSPTNIKFIQPGYTTETFTTNHLDKLRGSGAIRFMAWSRMNHTTGAPECDEWADRRLTTSVTQAGFCGPAPEYAIELCNELNADCWFTVPHAYTDAAMASLAALVNANLETGLKVYVESSNELWNTGFDQGDEMCADGDALWNDLDGDIFCFTENDVEERTYKARYAAKRTAALADAFLAAFSDDSRIRVVIGIQSGQSGATHYNELVLEAFSNASVAGVSVNPSGVDPYLYAGAPYFGGALCADMNTAGTLTTATAADVVTELYRTYLDDGVARVTADVVVAQAYNASKGWSMLVGQYEGGNGNEDTGETGCNAVAFSSQRAAGMRDLMRRYVRDIFDVEGALRGIYMHYNSPESYGDVDAILSHVYGLVESSQDDETTVPKWQGWQDVVR